MPKRQTTTAFYIVCLIVGLIIFVMGLSARTLWITYVGMAIQLSGPSLIWLAYWRAAGQRKPYQRAKTEPDREVRRYILVLFAMALLVISLEMLSMTSGWPLMSCVWLATALMGGLIAWESLKYRRK